MRENLLGDAFGHAFLYVGVAGRGFGIAVAEGFLNQAQILGCGIEICPCTVAKDMAADAGLFIACFFQCLVHDETNAVS